MMSSMTGNFERLISLTDKLIGTRGVEAKLDLLDGEPGVAEFFQESGPVQTFVQGLTPDCTLAIKSIVAIGQAPVVFRMPAGLSAPFERLRTLLQDLLIVERAYEAIGGIVGYHTAVLRLVLEQDAPPVGSVHYSKPPGVDLTQATEETAAGIVHMDELAEIYVVGGAGDRLDLRDETTGEPLPAGCLPFLGRSLIEGLFRDLIARERLCAKKVVTPVALMTSEEKDNHRKILEILEANHYFGRPRESIRLFQQPLVPVINVEGNWSLSDTLTLVRKPGGHGVMWQQAVQDGIFEWFKSLGRRKALVRQVNNPVAGCDNGILGFTGVGLAEDRVFGFASCPRKPGAAEGMDVLVERDGRYIITNVEYTDFVKRGIADRPELPANVNMLFADIDSIDGLLKKNSLPGVVINMKREAPYIGPYGEKRMVKAGRLEAMMQNLADVIDAAQVENHPTYVTYNTRRKTISVTKNSYVDGSSIEETPVGALYAMLQNTEELLRDHCKVGLPALASAADYVRQGPGFFFLYHPALGPLYAAIAQKIRGGRLLEGAECQLEIADLTMVNVVIRGSLLVESADLSGRCILEDVTIDNAGIDWMRTPTAQLWRNRPERKEALRIVLQPGATLIARGITLSGSRTIEVPAGKTVTLVD